MTYHVIEADWIQRRKLNSHSTPAYQHDNDNRKAGRTLNLQVVTKTATAQSYGCINNQCVFRPI